MAHWSGSFLHGEMVMKGVGATIPGHHWGNLIWQYKGTREEKKPAGKRTNERIVKVWSWTIRVIGNALEELFERGADGWSMEILVKVLYFVQIRKDAQQSVVLVLC